MTVLTQDFLPSQIPLDEPELLSVEDMLPDEYDADAAEDLLIQSQFWNRNPRFAKSVVLNYINAVENNWTTPETAVADMLSFGVLPCETVVEMLGVFLRASEKMEA